MTPKEKAEQLREKYHKYLDNRDYDKTLISSTTCAIIAVNEILSIGLYPNDNEFYSKVKEELVKILERDAENNLWLASIGY